MESVKGIPLYKNRQYQLISIHNNKTGKNLDSMAVMYMYVLDKEFDIKKVNPS
ncbi:MAG: hypothetical protein GTN59_09775 [Candidatus Dadabacteria bacterium]|nr:hypothetical protein [Candidatus Dadabacteria bacterium]